MSKYYVPLETGKRYHLFNHAIGNELLFRSDDNFRFFLTKYVLHINAICDTLGYILMPNHFHFLVKIKSSQECLTYFEQIKNKDFDPFCHNLSDFIMERFSNLFNSYAKAYNKVFERKGSLFIDYMKRSEIADDAYLRNVTNYIHFNAVHHGFCEHPLDWKWNSLHYYLAKKKNKASREVLHAFGDYDTFKQIHSEMTRPLSEYEFD